MIVIRLLGGMSNQMFQRAYGLALEARGHQVGFDRSHLIERTHREYSLAEFGDQCIAAPTQKFIYEGSDLGFHESLLQPDEGSTIVGYFQTEKYFEGIDVRKAFTFRTPLSVYANILKSEIEASNSVFLHVRRKDYLESQQFHGMPQPDYYQRALEYFPGAKVYVFSDEPEWCKAHEGFKDFKVVEHNNKYEDMQLMAACKGSVIVNSSYSWWAAWLTDRPGKVVVAPKQWFATDTIKEEIVPERWIKL
jgi:hypothetical protein